MLQKVVCSIIVLTVDVSRWFVERVEVLKFYMNGQRMAFSAASPSREGR